MRVSRHDVRDEVSCLEQLMSAIARLCVATLLVVAWASCAGSPTASSAASPAPSTTTPPNPPQPAASGALALTRTLWTTISTPQNFPLANDPSGNLTFDFPTAPNSMGYVYSTRPPGTIAGSVVVSFQITTTGAPVFNYASPDNTCMVPAKVRPFIWAHGNSPAEFDRWWSNPIAFELAAESATMTVSLSPDRWSSVNGKFGNADAGALAGFQSALKAVSSLGLTFGGGCFFGHGVDVSGGTARFVLSKYAVS